MNGFIYKISNTENDHVYIGKTISSVERRFQEHIRDSRKEHINRRPLYDAIRKYGANNFYIEIIEECDYKLLSEREVYWIKFYGSFEDGYNATLGGDGKVLYDYEAIVEGFQNGMLIEEIAEYFGCNRTTIRKILHLNEIDGRINRFNRDKKPVDQYDKTGNLLNSFSSYQKAAQWIRENGISSADEHSIETNIGRVVTGKRKTSCGFIWKAPK